ncbi:DnaJ domain-containing protein [Dioscorea alata]|uniref:DnaJ domain-containing protein n=1 Tax=Dioscorea alata TaxID=55571 RepID=A0ACB7TQ09_DIOAL|nr:DnaJ domain-containing protein [Dioscorea alata]
MEDPQAALPAGRPRTRHSRKGASGVAGGAGGMKVDYDDVFGGLPRFSGPAKATRGDEYVEIFGDFAASCSIPFLELPVGFDDVDAGVDPRAPGFDYREIFGGFSGSDFGVSYEELIAGKTLPEDSNGRVPKKTSSRQQASEVSNLASPIPGNEFVASVEEDQIIFDLHQSNGGIKKLDMSGHNTNWGGVEGGQSAPLTKDHTIPGYNSVLDGYTIPGDSIPEMKANDLSLSSDPSDPNGKIADMKPEKISMPASDDASTGSSVFDLKDVKSLSTKSPASEDVSANRQSHSRSSSYHSTTSSGDISFHDPTYVTISEISLRTQPLEVPPPSRPPPKLSNKQSHPKIKIYSSTNDAEGGSLYRQTSDSWKYYSSSFSKTDAVQGSVKDGSYFFDVEVDASSAAAASAAAMKEAMEQAQAKLKSAKELMGRKRDSFQSRKKLPQHDNINFKERKEVVAAEEVNCCIGDIPQMSFAKDDEKMNDFLKQERQKHTKATKIAIDLAEKETGAGKEQTLQGEKSKSSPYNLEEKTVEQKIDNLTYEQEEKEVDKQESCKHTQDREIAIDQEKKEIYAGKKQALQGKKLKSSPHDLEEKAEERKIEDQFYEQKEKEMDKQERQHHIDATKIAIDLEEKEMHAGKEQALPGQKLKASQYNLEDKTGERKIDGRYCEREEKEMDKQERQKHTKVTKTAFDKDEKEMHKQERQKDTKATKIIIHQEEKEAEKQERQKHTKATETAVDQEEKEMYAGKERTLQDKKSVSSQYDLEEKAGEWKIDNQYYELINNNKKCKPAQKLSEQECAQKTSKGTKVQNEHEQDCKVVETPNELKKSRKLWAVNEPRVVEKIQVNAETMASREDEIKEILSAIREAHVQEKHPDVQEVADVFSLGEENEKSEDAQEVYPGVVDEIKEDAIKETTCEPHESENVQKIADRTSVVNETGKEFDVLKYSFMPEPGKIFTATQEDIPLESFEKKHESSELGCAPEIHEIDSKTDVLLGAEGINALSMMQESCGSVESKKAVYIDRETNKSEENVKLSKAAKGPGEECEIREDSKTTKVPLGHVENAKKMAEAKEVSLENQNKKGKENLQELENHEHIMESMTENSDESQMMAEADNIEEENEKPKLVQATSNLGKSHNGVNKARVVCQDPEDFELVSTVNLDGNCNDANADLLVGQQPVNESLEAVRQVRLPESEKKGKLPSLLKVDSESHCVGAVDNSNTNSQKTESMKSAGRKRESEREHEKEWAKKLEEKEREREREKDRLAVERATSEAHERALAEARERAERIAVERVTAEARQRALAEAREKAEKASAEALEKSLAEKASREAKLRAERAAVERATAEARERAVERAIAEKAAAEARDQAERLNGSFRDKIRKDNEALNNLRSSDKGDGGIRIRPGSHDIRHNESQNVGSTQKYSASINHGAAGESALRCKARLERHQRTVERAAKALAEKNMRDILAQREQAERNRLAESLDADVKRWSNGKEGNLRALLSTLQYILGPDSGWQPIPLTEVITAAAAKKAYRRATLCVHPDKLQQRGASIQQKYICEKVFDLLKEAWNKFNSEER